MAKREQHGNKEAKKPKQPKKPVAGTSPFLAPPTKSGATSGGKKR